MDSKFIPGQVESKIYDFWERKHIFRAEIDPKKKPFCIVLPPPNANGHLHVGHGMFVYEDILIRYHKMQGDSAYWLLGLDHAGFETQYVFEKQLQKKGESRFQYDRETLFKMIWDFVMASKHTIKGQMRRLGFSLDWSREKFTMDEDVVKIVYTTFKKMYEAGLLYRANRLVNYCTKDGTSFSDLEVVSEDMEGQLYYIKFPLKAGGFITIATTRPETLLGDVAVMVNPSDKRYKHLIGSSVILPIVNREIPIIADAYVDPKFGTGAVKVTPAHDFNDFEIAKKHNLVYPPIIGFNGKMQNTGIVDGLRVKAAREEVMKRLTELGLIEKIMPHKMVIKKCYKCGTILEPLPLEQWYVKIRPLADEAKRQVTSGEIKVYPKRFTKILLAILDNFIDWNISRQIVWGIRIPAYRCEKTGKWFVSVEKPEKCEHCEGCNFVQDPDTLDTWFSSAQWPFATLMSQGNDIYEYFYPTAVMETGHDILRAWVARMIMVGSFVTGKVPFKNVFLHGMVRDGKGQKMSKSKGNVIDPLVLVDKYGADAFRAALLYGTKEGGDVALSENKVIGMRNFTNKIWNIARFLQMMQSGTTESEGLLRPNAPRNDDVGKKIKELETEVKGLVKKYNSHMKRYQFSMALDLVYQFVWHRFADYYIEQLKEPIRNDNIEALEALKKGFESNLKMLHPFMPFVTEAIWQITHGEEASLLNEHVG